MSVVVAKTVMSPLFSKTCVLCKKTNVPSHQTIKAQIADFFSRIFDTGDWPPRWHCGTWSDFHGWLYIVSDLTIWASYFAIPLLLIRLLKGRPDIPFPRIVWLFVAFIVFCGLTHLMDAVIFWWPAYRLSALIRLLTGVFSAITVFALYKILPLAFSLRSVDELEVEIHQRRAAELALTETHDRLLTSHEQLRSFTHILSHNIRNHAANIYGITSMVERDTLTEANLDFINLLSQASAALNLSLNDLAEVIAVRDRKVERELLYFNEVYEQAAGVLRSDIQKHQVIIDTDFKVGKVNFPKIYLESILLNLLSNAIKYRDDSRTCMIRLRTFNDDAGKIVMECSDNGLGIDLELHGDKIFGLYHTFHNNKTAHGIGLFLIKTQIESQGGTISVESQPGKGATFSVIFEAV